MAYRRSVNRRQFIKDAFLLSLGSILISRFDHSELYAQDSGNEFDAIVVGAGISGLAAAKAIKSKGMKVLVLEARDRIGGRIWTEKIGRGVAVDLGASWIHGIKNNPIYSLSQKAKIKTAVTDYDSAKIYSSDGSAFAGGNRLDSFADILASQQENLREARFENGSADISLAEDFQNIINNFGLTAEEVKQLNFVINTYIEHEYAADAGDMSSLYWDEGREFGGSDVVFPKGYKQITSLLARGLTIKLSHEVSAIDYQGSSVKVSTSQGDYLAPKVIVTLPIGVLKAGNVSFLPALPEAKQSAISLIGSGLLNKTCLLFPKVFWPTNVHLLNYISEEKGRWCEWLNMHKYIKKPVLIGFNAGTYADTLEDLDDASTVASAMDTLRTIYGSSIPEPIDSLVTRWGKDPYSLGSYSHLSVGATPNHYDELAAPINGKVYFAGEATSRSYAATAHGAYLSGLREASKIR